MFNVYFGADSYVTYTGAADAVTGAPLDSGTCTFAVYTAGTGGGAAVAGATGTLSYVSGSSGNYQGVLPASVVAGLTPDAQYALVIAFAASGYSDQRTLFFRPKYRGAT